MTRTSSNRLVSNQENLTVILGTLGVAMAVAVLIYLLIAVAVPVITAWMAKNGIAA